MCCLASCTIGRPTLRARLRALRTVTGSRSSFFCTAVTSHSLRSNSARTAGVGAHELEREVGVAGDVAVADHHGDVGGQTLGAERGRAERGRHREEDDRAAVGRGQDRAALAARHVDADDGQVGRSAGGGHGVAQGDRVAGVADHAPRRRARWASEQVGLAPGGVRRRWCAGRRRDGPRPGTATRTCRRRRRPRPPASSYRRTWRSVSAGAPQTSITARAERSRQVVGKLGRDAAAEQDGVAVGRHLLAAAVPAGQPVLDDQRREGQRDQGGDPVADGEPERGALPHLLDGADEHAAGAGDRVVHLAAAAHDLEDLGAHGGPSPPCLVSSWRKDAASRLSRSTRTRTSSSRITGSVSSRWAACGSTPTGSSTRCMPTGSPVMRPTCADTFPLNTTSTRKYCGDVFDAPQTVS